MAKRKAQKRKRATSTARKRTPKRASGKRPTKKRQAKARSVKKRPGQSPESGSIPTRPCDWIGRDAPSRSRCPRPRRRWT